MPRVDGKREVITYPFYDSVRGGANPLAGFVWTFFSTPIGQGTSAVTNSGPKTQIDTNMPNAGQLPSPWMESIMALRVQLDPAVTILEAIDLVTKCWFKLSFGAKEYLTVPIIFLTGGGGIDGITVTPTTGAVQVAVHNGPSDPRAIFSLSRPIDTMELENFQAIITTAANLTVVTQSSVLRVVLDGELDRGVQ